MIKLKEVKEFIKNANFENLDIKSVKTLFILKLIEQKTEISEFHSNVNPKEYFYKKNELLKELLLKNLDGYLIIFLYKGKEFRLYKSKSEIRDYGPYNPFSIKYESGFIENIDTSVITEFFRYDIEFKDEELKIIEKKLFNNLDKIIEKIEKIKKEKILIEENRKKTIQNIENFFKN